MRRDSSLKVVRSPVVASLVLAIALSVPAGARGLDEGDTRVLTQSGWIRGTVEGPARIWAGIPYAAAPLGGLRWRPPAPPPTWTGVRDTTEFAEPCIQLAGEEVFLGSEDCLYLNVFAPKRPAGSSLPVMVHLHPGSNSGFHPYTDADTFVRRGVIVVTVGYRLGVFGWVGHPALSAEAGGSSGEYGVLDQLAALEWVQENIGAFGGDPENVTLFGQSAGSFDATAIVASPLGTGLIRRAALETEAWWPLHGTDTIRDGERLGVEVAEAVGCSGAPDIPACLRARPAEELVSALGFIDVSPRVGGEVLPRSPLELITEQRRTIPLLVGSDREEAAFFFFEAVAGLERYRKTWWFRDTNAIVGRARGDEVRKHYSPQAYGSRLWAAVAAFSDAIYTCPMRELALAADGPVWRYLYKHRLENDEFFAQFRASHFLEEPILWQDPELLSGFGRPPYEPTRDDDRLSRNMARYWTNFAKAGDPNGRRLLDWPSYGPSRERLVVLDEPLGDLGAYHRRECEFWDGVPELFPPSPKGGFRPVPPLRF